MLYLLFINIRFLDYNYFIFNLLTSIHDPFWAYPEGICYRIILMIA